MFDFERFRNIHLQTESSKKDESYFKQFFCSFFKINEKELDLDDIALCVNSILSSKVITFGCWKSLVEYIIKAEIAFVYYLSNSIKKEIGQFTYDSWHNAVKNGQIQVLEELDGHNSTATVGKNCNLLYTKMKSKLNPSKSFK
jgi:hypothetical protein